ncbi:MAG: hypothetical protein Q8909_01230 [Bacteroidota bacterium]|nr:hypothetical protein [Bacteroidota bacterium]
MAKVFRLHNGDNTIVDWQVSSKYGADAINQIKDPDGATTKKEITSIPSPFARIDLVKTAFQVISESRDLDGTPNGPTIYHKMVSDSLDVGEIFFNSDKLKDKIQILVWDKTTDLEALLKSTDPAHVALGETLSMYLTADASAYNFDKLRRLYLLNYIGREKPAQFNIIGSTSPVTLFFSSANNLGYVSNHIQFGQDKPFDSEYQPLYKRDFEYQKYLYAFRLGYKNGQFAADFKDFDRYLDVNYSHLSDEQKKIIDSLDEKSVYSYEELNADTGANYVEILNNPLRKRLAHVSFQSDFEIDSNIFNGTKPLVLPVEKGNTYTNFVFTTAKWTKNEKGPYFDNTPWLDRTLPFDGAKYPYLTVSDFLEERLVRMPYKLNEESFFNGNLMSGSGFSYLLPIKKLFFEFFRVDELKGEVCGRKMFEIQERAGECVSVILRIPVKGGCVEYNRLYFANNEPSQAANEGAIVDKKFGLALFPPIRFGLNENPHYRIAVFDKGADDVLINCHQSSQIVEIKHKVERRKKTTLGNVETCSVESYVVENCFDLIAISVGRSEGVVIPCFKQNRGQSQFTFAVDFGTTNTHIEYSVDGNPSSPYSIENSEKQIQRLHLNYNMDADIDEALDNNFIPGTIGDQNICTYPMRTVFAEHKDLDYSKPTYTLASGNIPFLYEKAIMPPYNKIKTNLKWSVHEKERIRLFLENIFILLRNKVLLNNGDLEATRIVWFYPASMTEAQCNRFKNTWTELYKEYFGLNLANLIMMSESIAPYHYYQKKLGAKSNVVTIDIGGGTTDVYVVEDYKPKMLSSFRFASNAIFGDGYNWDADNNGFVTSFKPEFVMAFESNRLEELQHVFNEIASKKDSSDIIAFLFSLSSNKHVKEANIRSVDFLQKLSDDDDLKYVFILFYSSILYYVARSIKAKGLQMPLTIAFSGNGSKTLSVLSSDKGVLKKFAKLIFEAVFDEMYSNTNDLDIIFEEKPKEATCKGGIAKPESQNFDEIDDIKSSLIGYDMVTFAHNHSYSIIDERILNQISEEVIRFIEFTFTLNKNNDSFFVKRFSANAKIADEVKRICLCNLHEYTKKGLHKKLEELRSLGAEGDIEETLFFYPLIGVLNNLAREIAKIKTTKS